MKRTLLLLVLLGLPAAAQWRHFGSDEPRLTGFFGLGASTAVNPAATRLDDVGWNLASGVGVTTRYVGVMFEAMFNEFGLNRDALYRIGVPRGNQKYWALTVNPIFHVNERGPIDFYITGGGGLYSRITDLRARSDYGGPFSYGGDLLASYTVYKPGVNGGAGFAFNIGGRGSRVKLFTEARFHHMFIGRSGDSFIPVTVGIRF